MDEVKALADPGLSNTATAETPRIPVPTVLREMVVFGGRKRGRIYFNTGRNLYTSGQSYAIKIVGNKGSQKFVFASNTTRIYIIDTINLFKRTTSVGTLEDGSSLIRLLSLRKGPNQFVGAKKIVGNRDGLLLNEWRRQPANRQLDFGE